MLCTCATCGDGDGDGDGEGRPKAGASEGAPGATRYEGMGVEVGGVDVEGMVADRGGGGVVEGERGAKFGVPCAPRTADEEEPRDIQRG